MDIHNMNLVRMTDEELERLHREFDGVGNPQRFVSLTELEAKQLEPLSKDERKGWMRNKKCPCKSGKKFKNCCWHKYASKRDGGHA